MCFLWHGWCRYRARVEEKTAKGFKVLYIDYGNRATVTLDQIRNLDTSYTGLAAQVGGTT